MARGVFHFACFQLSRCSPLHLKGKYCAGVLILLLTVVVYCFYWAALLNPPQPVRTNKVVHIEIDVLSQPLVWTDLQCFLPRTCLHCRNLLQSSVRVYFFCLQAPDEAALSGLSESLTQAGVSHKLWIEQPENIPTCLALKPYPKETVQPLMRKFKLFK